MVPKGMVSKGMVSKGMVSKGMVPKGMVPKGEICQNFKTNQSIAKQCHNLFKPSHVLDGKY
jgi:hypothetical protein